MCVCVNSDVYDSGCEFSQDREAGRGVKEEEEEEGRKQDEDRKDGAGQDRVGLRDENLTGIETNGRNRKESCKERTWRIC